MGFHHAGQDGLELQISSDPPASASQSAVITGVSHCAWLAHCIVSGRKGNRVFVFRSGEKYGTYLELQECKTIEFWSWMGCWSLCIPSSHHNVQNGGEMNCKERTNPAQDFMFHIYRKNHGL